MRVVHEVARGVAAALLLAAGGVAAFAQGVAGTSSGTWVNPLPSTPPVVTSGLGTPTFLWGDASVANVGQNSLSFAGNAFSDAFETPFTVGRVTYFNGTVAVGTTPDSVQLSLDLNFTTPGLGPIASLFTFGLVPTINTGDPDGDADFIILPSAFSSTTFLIGSTTYTVQLTGFSNVIGDGFLPSNPLQFNVREGLSASADLNAVVTTRMVPAIPEPETYALMLAGLAALGAVARRRRRAGRGG